MGMVAEASETDESACHSETGAPYRRELAIKIDDLALSVRASNVLKNAGIKYVRDLVQLTENQVGRFQHCGRITVKELRDVLAGLGLGFGMDLDSWNRPRSPESRPTEESAVNSEKGALAIKIDDLFLSVRASNVLKNAGIKHVRDLVQLTENQVGRFQHCGRKTVKELQDVLAGLGVSFSSDALSKRTISADLDENTRTKLYLRVDEIGLSQRARNMLKDANIEFLGDLIGKTEIQLGVRSCSHLTLAEIKNKLKGLGLRLGFSVSDWNTDAAREIRKQQDANPEAPIAALRRSLNSTSPSDFLEDELRAVLAFVDSERGTDIALKQLGWSGKGQRTLESVGQEYSITRERVRQIVARKTRAISKECIERPPRLDQALAIVRARSPATAAELASELRLRGVSKNDFDPTGLETACDIFQRKFGLKRISLRHVKVYAVPEDAKRIIDFFRLCRRLTSSQGCANFEVVCDELRIPESVRQRMREFATTESICEWLGLDRRWLFSTGVPRNRLSNLVAKVLCVAPHVYLTELRKAVARSRRLAVVPPVGVLAHFVQRFELASVSDGRASAISDFAAAIAPESAESILVSVLRMHGPILAGTGFKNCAWRLE
jgi:DNA-directed RNA polymerase alpha subunit